MKKINICILITVLGSLLILLTSCETVNVYQKPGYGPPAHAKAHGLRNKQTKTIVQVEVKKEDQLKY
ncbi:MAG: hypothetical protein JW715_12040 [Sedimentisphaerales bacterium]|nr:hypothetical protein [Sedimentisphaerales bacterium]